MPRTQGHTEKQILELKHKIEKLGKVPPRVKGVLETISLTRRSAELEAQERFLRMITAYIIHTARDKTVKDAEAMKTIRTLTDFGEFFIEVEKVGAN